MLRSAATSRAWPWALLIAVVVTGGATRFALSRTHFSHIDDMGVAADILAAKSYPPTADALLDIARDKQAAGSASPRVALLLELERRGVWRPLYAIAAPVYPYIVVPLGWTYAPLQFIVTGLLIHPGQDYESVKAWGRSPSVMLSIACILLVALCALRLGGAGAMSLPVVAAALVAGSGEHTINAALMHSYAATSAASAAMLLFTIIDARRVQWPWGFIARRAFSLIALSYLGYQAVMLWPGYCAALGIGALKRRPSVRRREIVTGTALIAAIAGLGFLPAYLFRVAGIVTVHYNAGPHGEFAFRRHGGTMASLLDGAQFLAVNSWIVLKSLVAPVPDDSRAAAVIASVVAIALVVGLTRMIAIAGRPRAWSAPAAAGVYAAVTLFVLFAMALAGKLALGPTRHVLVYLPVIAVPAAYGLRTLTVLAACRLRAVRPNAAWAVASAVLALAVMVAYVGHTSTLFRERQDPFDEAQLAALARSYRVDLVVTGGADQVLAMPSLIQYWPVRSTVPISTWKTLLERPVAAPRRILFASQEYPFDREQCQKLQALLIARAGLLPWQPCLSGVRILYSAAKPSNVEVEFSQRTRNGTNGLYVAVVEWLAR